MNTLIIDRNIWAHGSFSFLYDGKKFDILGFYLSSIGFTDEDLLFQITSGNISHHRKLLEQDNKPMPKSFLVRDDKKNVVFDSYGLPKTSDLCYKIIDVNDNPNLIERKRETELSRIFSQLGVQLEFKG